MYYEFKIEDGFDYYALIKANNKKEAYKIYKENIIDDSNLLTKKANKITEKEAYETFINNVYYTDENIKEYTIEDLRNEEKPILILVDGNLM